jgi:hypothetical protein
MANKRKSSTRITVGSRDVTDFVRVFRTPCKAEKDGKVVPGKDYLKPMVLVDFGQMGSTHDDALAIGDAAAISVVERARKRDNVALTNAKRREKTPARSEDLKREYRKLFAKHDDNKCPKLMASALAIKELARRENVSPARMRRIVEPAKELRRLTSR